MNIKKNVLTIAFIVLNALSFHASADAIYAYNFDRITTTSPNNVGNQLLLEISSNPLNNNVYFKFYNSVGISSSITDIYFDTGNTNLFRTISMYADSDTSSTTGVVFDNSAQPANLPSGNTIGFTADFSGDSPTPAKGVDKLGEWVTYMGVLNTGKSFEALIQGLTTGNFMVGLHVQAIGTASLSDSYVNKKQVNAVPLPAAGWLFGSALMGFIMVSNRRRV